MSHLLSEDLAGVSSGSQEVREGVRRSAEEINGALKLNSAHNENSFLWCL